MTVLEAPLGNPEFEEMRTLVEIDGEVMSITSAAILASFSARQYGFDRMLDFSFEGYYDDDDEKEEYFHYYSGNGYNFQVDNTLTESQDRNADKDDSIEPENDEPIEQEEVLELDASLSAPLKLETIVESEEEEEEEEQEEFNRERTNYYSGEDSEYFEGQSNISLACFVPLTEETFLLGVQPGWTLEECKQEVYEIKQRKVERFCLLGNISLHDSMKVGELDSEIPITVIYHPIEAEILKSVRFQSISGEEEPFEMDVNLNWTWEILSDELSRNQQQQQHLDGQQLEMIFLGNEIIRDVRSLANWEYKFDVVTLCFRD